MTKKQQALEAISRLEQLYPQAECTLEYTIPHQLMIATRLAAQCTDARVNLVTPVLFTRFPTLQSLAQAEVAEVMEIVHSCGFYRTKAQDIVAACQMLLSDFGGVMPETMEELLTLPGVGRKTANLLLGDLFGKPAIVCDTHCIRITNLLGLTTGTDPAKVEQQLLPLLPPQKSNDFCHRLVMLGREICVARRPQCDRCPLDSICKHTPKKDA
ncbi:MAG: endonuclease III [Angelakisella sp.]